MDAHATFEHVQRLSERMRRFMVSLIVLVAAAVVAVILAAVLLADSGSIESGFIGLER